MIRVELIYDAGCPNLPKARAVLIQAFAAVQLTPRWNEWERDDVRSPDYAHRFGSPTRARTCASVRAESILKNMAVAPDVPVDQLIRDDIGVSTNSARREHQSGLSAPDKASGNLYL